MVLFIKTAVRTSNPRFPRLPLNKVLLIMCVKEFFYNDIAFLVVIEVPVLHGNEKTQKLNH
jgi:hypothetical protein